MKEHGDKLSESEKKDVEDALQRCKNAKETSNNPDEIKSAIAALTTASHKLAEQMYKESASQQSAASSEGQHHEKEEKSAGEEEVVDAEFEDAGKNK